MAEWWRLDKGHLVGCQVGSVVTFKREGDEIQVWREPVGLVTRISAKSTTQQAGDNWLRLTNADEAIDVTLTRVAGPSDAVPAGAPHIIPGQPVVVRTYQAKSQDDAAQQMTADASMLAEQGYYPVTQSWAPGAYGCGAFLAALVLCFLLVGFLIFVYMLIVKPDGTLTVTYQLRDAPPAAAPVPAAQPDDTKVCPRCAETVKAAAKVCRYCGHEFDADAAPAAS